jgi:hypothetical protein
MSGDRDSLLATGWDWLFGGRSRGRRQAYLVYPDRTRDGFATQMQTANPQVRLDAISRRRRAHLTDGGCDRRRRAASGAGCPDQAGALTSISKTRQVFGKKMICGANPMHENGVCATAIEVFGEIVRLCKSCEYRVRWKEGHQIQPFI